MNTWEPLTLSMTWEPCSCSSPGTQRAARSAGWRMKVQKEEDSGLETQACGHLAGASVTLPKGVTLKEQLNSRS